MNSAHEQQCISFAYGNVGLHNPDITKDDMTKAAMELRMEQRADVETGRDQMIAAKNAEIAALKDELAIIKYGERNHPDRIYATTQWLKTFGFKVFAELKHGDVGWVLSLLESGDISRGKAAEAIAELLVGGKPLLPDLHDDTWPEDVEPREYVAGLKAENERCREIAERDGKDYAEAITALWETREALKEWSGLANHLGLSTTNHRRRTEAVLAKHEEVARG